MAEGSSAELAKLTKIFIKIKHAIGLVIGSICILL